MVEALVLLGVFDGHDILDVFHHADNALCTFGTGTDGAGVGVAETVADVAIVDVGGETVIEGVDAFDDDRLIRPKLQGAARDLLPLLEVIVRKSDFFAIDEVDHVLVE